MKLYATVESERASKGQGGNKSLYIKLLQEIDEERVEVGQVVMEPGKLHFMYNMISDDVTVTINHERIKAKRQKGKLCNCGYNPGFHEKQDDCR